MSVAIVKEARRSEDKKIKGCLLMYMLCFAFLVHAVLHSVLQLQSWHYIRKKAIEAV